MNKEQAATNLEALINSIALKRDDYLGLMMSLKTLKELADKAPNESNLRIDADK